MSIPKFILIATFSLLTSLSLNVFADGDQSLADLVRDRVQNSNQAAQSHQSTSFVPGYCEQDKNNIEERLGSIEVGVQIDHLKSEGEKVRKEAVANNPDGAIATMVEATDFKRVKGFEGYSDLKMFTEADKYMQDPVGQMSLLKDKGCIEKVNNKRKGFVRKENRKTVNDIIEDIKSCEALVSNFKCNKLLEVTCKKKAECDYGGISKGSVSKGMMFDSNNGFLTMGTYDFNYLKGNCTVYEDTSSFNIENTKLVSVFKLVHVRFDDYMKLTLNGHVIYVGPFGGNDLTVRGGRVFNGIGNHDCEKSIDRNLPVNIDLKPFIKDGKNEITMKVIVSGWGHGWFRIKAKQQCCENDDWKENWVEHCEQTS